MPSDITTPAPTAAVSRLTLATEHVRGTGTENSAACMCVCPCFADDAE